MAKSPSAAAKSAPAKPGRRMRRLDNIDLRLLRVFVTLAENGSFQAAQIALNLSQSTLSTHIAALEQKLGGSLCVRGRRGFRLTPFGEATLHAATRLFADIDAFQQRLGRRNGELVGRLRIGIVDGVVSSPVLGLQTAIARYMERGPGVFVDLELGTPHELERSVAEGRRHVVIGPFSQKAPGIVYVPVHREPHALYCGNGHPLFSREPDTVTHEDIEHSLFSVRSYRHLDDLYRVGHPRASGSVIHMEAQVMLILSGHFVGFLPCHIGEQWAAQGLMRALRNKVYGHASQHFAAYRRSAADEPLVKAFLQELQRQAKM
jgi:DNA-binding transcriptional LysR family regulator